MTHYRQPTAQELLGESHWLRRLLDDALPAHAVDDALQDTWTLAMRGVPRSPTALRPWLRTVARRVATAMRRSEVHRQRREREVARPERQPATEEIVQRLDLQQQVTAIVRELPEPYRSTVLLRVYEDESVAKLAARFGTTPDNVYARLARARVMIRERLPEDAQSRLPLVLVPAASGVVWIVAATLVVGALGVGALGVGLRPLFVEEPASTGRLAANESLPPTPIPSQIAAAAPDPLDTTVPARAPLETPKPVPRAARPQPTLQVDVAPPPARATLSLVPAEGAVQTTTLDWRGRGEFADARPGQVTLQLRPGPELRYEKRFQILEPAAAIVWQLGTGDLRVLVHANDGTPAGNAFVWLQGPGFEVRTRTDPDGRRLVPMLPAGDYRLYVSIEEDGTKVLEQSRKLAIREHVVADAVFGRPGGLPRWRGTLRNAQGELVTGATPQERGKLVLTHTRTRALVPVFVDSAGRFDVRLAAGEYRMLVSPPSFEGAYHRVPDLAVHAREIQRDVTLPGARLVVQAPRDLAPGSVATLTPEDPRRTHRTRLRADRTFIFDGLSPGSWRLTGAHIAPQTIEIGKTAGKVTLQAEAR